MVAIQLKITAALVISEMVFENMTEMIYEGKITGQEIQINDSSSRGCESDHQQAKNLNIDQARGSHS